MRALPLLLMSFLATPALALDQSQISSSLLHRLRDGDGVEPRP